MPLRENLHRPRRPAFSPPSSQRTGRSWYKGDSHHRRRLSSQPRRHQSSPHRRPLCSRHRRRCKRRRQCRRSSLARRRRSSPLRRRQCSQPRRLLCSRHRRRHRCRRRRQPAGSPCPRQHQAPATSTLTMASAILAWPRRNRANSTLQASNPHPVETRTVHAANPRSPLRAVTALLAQKQAFSNANSVNALSSWVQGGNPCDNWGGVTCGQDGAVTAL